VQTASDAEIIQRIDECKTPSDKKLLCRRGVEALLQQNKETGK